MCGRYINLILSFFLVSAVFAMERNPDPLDTETNFNDLPGDARREIARFADEDTLKALMRVDQKSNMDLQRVKGERMIEFDVRSTDQKGGLINYLSKAKEQGFFVSVKLSGVQNQDLEELRPYLDPVKDLDLFDNYYLNNIEALAGLKNLQTLDLSKTSVSDLNALAHTPMLQTLTLISCVQLRDVSGLAHAPMLQTLTLNFCLQLHDLSPLAHAPMLHTLNLRDNWLLHDLSPLAQAPMLQNLDLSYLANPMSLRVISTRDKILDVSPLAQAPMLQTLSLTNIQVTGVDVLVNAPNLLRVEPLDEFKDLNDQLQKRRQQRVNHSTN